MLILVIFKNLIWICFECLIREIFQPIIFYKESLIHNGPIQAHPLKIITVEDRASVVLIITWPTHFS